MRAKFAAAVAAIVFLAAGAGAQSLEQVMRNARDMSVKYAQNVNNYTTVQDVGGVEVTQYCEKHMVSGFPTFSCRTIAPSMGQMGGGADDESARKAAEVFASEQFLQRAKLQGAETIDGKRAHKIVLEDFTGIAAFEQTGAQTAQMKPKRVTYFIDASQYLPLKMTMEADVMMNGSMRPITTTMLMQDYRETQGYLHPFKLVTSIEGMAQAMTPEQRKQMDDAKAQMAKLPPEIRAMAEKQMAAMSAVAGEGMVITVKSLRVNTGPPR